MLIKFIRYGLVQVAAYGLEFSIFMLIMLLGPHLVIANCIAKSISAIFAFFLHKHFTFKKKDYQKHHSRWNSDVAKMKKEIGGKREKYSVIELNNQLSLLKKIIADCNRIHAKLILVWAPQYFELNAFQEPTLREMKNKMKQIALENKNVVFWDFTNNPLNFDKKYFYNSFHMNDVGVAQFCQQFWWGFHRYHYQ